VRDRGVLCPRCRRRDGGGAWSRSDRCHADSLITKVHNEAQRLARDDYDALLIGHEGHDEVVGTAGARQRRLRTDATRRWAAAWQTIRTSFRLNPTDLTTPIRKPTGPGNVRLTRRHGTDHPRRHAQSHCPPTQLGIKPSPHQSLRKNRRKHGSRLGSARVAGLCRRVRGLAAAESGAGSACRYGRCRNGRPATGWSCRRVLRVHPDPGLPGDHRRPMQRLRDDARSCLDDLGDGVDGGHRGERDRRV